MKKLTKTQKANVVNALHRCKPFLAKKRKSNKETYICYAVSNGCPKSFWSLPVKEQDNIDEGVDLIVDIIMERLAPCYNVNEWLCNNVPEYYNLTLNQQQDAAQVYRHRWVDELIREFS